MSYLRFLLNYDCSNSFLQYGTCCLLRLIHIPPLWFCIVQNHISFAICHTPAAFFSRSLCNVLQYLWLCVSFMILAPANTCMYGSASSDNSCILSRNSTGPSSVSWGTSPVIFNFIYPVILSCSSVSEIYICLRSWDRLSSCWIVSGIYSTITLLPDSDLDDLDIMGLFVRSYTVEYCIFYWRWELWSYYTLF